MTAQFERKKKIDGGELNNLGRNKKQKSRAFRQ